MAAGLAIGRIFHGLAVVFMVLSGIALGVGILYWLGVAICAALLAYENAIVTPDDLSRVNAAFFNVNAILAGIYLAAVIGDVAVR
jgi:4-hydroxybenzoate polyprenyltransferase